MFANLSIAKKLYAGFGVVLLILLVLVLTTWRGFGQVVSTVKSNIHSYDVLGESASLLTSLINIETGMRGFVITGREPFLGPLTEGERSFQEHLAQLRRLTADNPAQQRRLGQLQTLHDQWAREDIQANVELRRQVAAGAKSLETLIEQIGAGATRPRWTPCGSCWPTCRPRKPPCSSSATWPCRQPSPRR